jgi:hypothetical protein
MVELMKRLPANSATLGTACVREHDKFWLRQSIINDGGHVGRNDPKREPKNQQEQKASLFKCISKQMYRQMRSMLR